MIDQHIKILTEKASGIETRLYSTNETLTPGTIINLCEELSKTVEGAKYLMQIKQIREQRETQQSKIVKPNASQILVAK